MYLYITAHYIIYAPFLQFPGEWCTKKTMSFRQVVRCRGVVTFAGPHIQPATHDGTVALVRHTCSVHLTSLCTNDISHSERRTDHLPGAVSVARRCGLLSFSAVFANAPHCGQSKRYGTLQGKHVEPDLSTSSHMSATTSEVDAVIADVKHKLRRRTVNIDLLTPVVDLLLQSGFKKEHIIAAATTSPRLMSQSRRTWERAIHDLTEYGFSKEHMLPVVLGYPPVLKGNMDGLSTMLETLYSLYVPSDKANELVALCPDILQQKPKVIVARFGLLMDVFRRADIVNLLLTNPSLLVDDWSDIMERFHYVYFRLGFEQQVMRNCQVLSHPLDHIKQRHLFLKRAGLYEKPDKHGVTTVTNPKLRQIVDTTDHEFAVNVAGMTLAEFRAFAKILQLEAEQERDGLEDEWDTEEEDSDET